MKKCVLWIALLLASSCVSAQVSIFNGRDLSGWTIYGTEKWFVEKGELICESGPDNQYGYLATEATYGDFELTLDFFQESNGNSGVFFHCSVDGTRVSGWQAEVAPPGLHTGGIYESYGRGWLIKPVPEKESVLKPGSWNSMKVRVLGKQVTTWLNGTEMITLEDAAIGSRQGKIALQIHDGGGVRVRWRKLMVKVL
ncbi:MAG: DUF1080 domain-containing protein [Cyclobacteriaceae bacterium]|nr:DUF1080 domain-containing protein [Cytophagales bacterium]HNP76366.1 DUF1080 domain-containing protein [Cyclobacteriaceae bacterium]